MENIFPFSGMCSKSISGMRDLFLFLAHYLISFVISFVSCTVTNVITSVTSSTYDEIIFVYRWRVLLTGGISTLEVTREFDWSIISPILISWNFGNFIYLIIFPSFYWKNHLPSESCIFLLPASNSWQTSLWSSQTFFVSNFALLNVFPSNV